MDWTLDFLIVIQRAPLSGLGDRNKLTVGAAMKAAGALFILSGSHRWRRRHNPPRLQISRQSRIAVIRVECGS